MFAIRNADCATLNAHARALHKERGDLGEDHTLKTATGDQQFATGDRIQFTGTSRKQAQKRAGLSNGNVGTVRGIEIDKDGRARLTVEFDAPRGEKAQRVSFVVGDDEKSGEVEKFRHGYAGTIYGGQGRTLDEAYVGHSSQWRSSAAYVALTRHRESIHIFAARETVKNLDEMAAGMARTDNKRAATVYEIDAASAERAELAKAVEAYRPPPASQSFAAAPAATETAATVEQSAPPVATVESAAPTIAQPATFAEASTETIATVEQIAARAEAKENRIIADTFAYDGQTPPAGSVVIAGDAGHVPAATMPAATIESAAPVIAATATHAPQEAIGEAASAGDNSPQVAPERVLDALGGFAGGVARLAEGVAEFAEGAIDALAGLFGGGSSAPAPKAAPPEAPPPPKRRLSVEEYVAQEIEQRKAERREIARQLGAGEAMTEDELRMEKEAQEKRRDRGGGISR